MCIFFFFQAEDGIRDKLVTGVQTCALPIWSLRTRPPVGAELDLASNDYLGLSQHPEVIDGGVEALRTWGAGSTGSRLVTGNTELHEDFETALADFVGAESALVFSSGYTANL